MNQELNNLSSVQKGIFFSQVKFPDSAQYNIGGYSLVIGQLDVVTLIECIKQQLELSDVLHNRGTLFGNEKTKIKANEFDIEYFDHSGRPDADAYCQDWMNKDIRKKIDFHQDLLKVRILKPCEEKYYVYFNIHHILFDGFSINIFVEKFLEVYSKRVQNAEEKLLPQSFKYSDFVEDENAYKLSEQYKTDELFWKNKFENLDTDRAFESCLQLSASDQSFRSVRKELALPRETFVNIQNFCTQNKVTVLHYFVGIIGLLNKLYNNNEFIISLPIFNRDNIRFKNTTGTFVKALPFPVPSFGDTSFLDILLQIKNDLNTCYRHKKFPIIELYSELNVIKKQPNILFSYQKNTYVKMLNAFSSDMTFLHNGEQQEDLQFHLLEYKEEGDLTIAIDYKEDSFSDQVINNLITHFNTLVNTQYTQAHLNVNAIEVTSKAERDEILEGFNNTGVAYHNDKTVVDLFEEQVKKIPDTTAVVFEDRTLTYKELNETANRLARYIQQNTGIKTGESIGVLADRSEWSVISMIAIMKLGCLYVPIDKLLPEKRIDHIIKDSKAKVLLVNEASTTASTNNIPCITITEIAEQLKKLDASNIGLTNLSQCASVIIYTSGSTGNSKGIEQTHTMLCNLISWEKNKSGLLTGQKYLQFSSFSFDMSLIETYYALTTGGELYVASETLRKNFLELKEYIIKNKIASISMPCAALEGMFSEVGFHESEENHIKEIISAGEQLYVSGALRTFLHKNPSVKIFNWYGPSETHVVTGVTHSFSNGDIPIKPTIGKPISNTEIYILDKEKRLLPKGVSGEICIGGDGLAHGYLNRPELTAEKFVSNPFKPGERMYKTGDIGRWLNDGSIDFIGRKDDQVKIRGYRIELGEVETVLRNVKNIDDAVVITREDASGEKQLVAYFVSKNEIAISDLREALGKLLPSYMVPAYFMQLEVMPLTSNGKINRKSLPDPQWSAMGKAVEHIAPRNETEERLAEIWAEVLAIEKEKIGVKDDFFDWGGHSLKAMRLVTHIYKNIGVKIDLKDLFSNTTLEEQATLISSKRKTIHIEIKPVEKQQNYLLSSSQRRIWVLSQFKEGNVAYNMAGVYVLDGELKKEELERSFRTLIRRHESLRTIFKEDVSTGEIRQWIKPEEEEFFTLRFEDLRNRAWQDEEVKQKVEKEMQDPFDLENGPLVRACLLRIADNKYVFNYTMHHIIGDGWSMGILVKELLSLYNAYAKGEEPVMKPLKLQYKDYAAWQREQLVGNSLNEHKAYWLEQFTSDIPTLEMPGDKPRPAVKTYNGAIIKKVIARDAVGKLKVITQKEGGTLFMGLLAIVNAILYRYTGQEDIIIGSPIAGREHIDIEDQIGFYVNTLALRTRFSGEDSYKQLLDNVIRTSINAYEHHVYPFDELVDDLKLHRGVSRSALFDVMVVLQNNAMSEHMIAEQTVGNAKLSAYPVVRSVVSKFDLTFNFAEVKKELHMAIEYNTDIYKKETVERLAGHFAQMMESVTVHPEQLIKEIDYVTAPEKHELLSDFNNTEAVYPKDKTLVDLFEGQVKKTPDNVALVFNGNALTYSELNERANSLACYLRECYSIKPEDTICIKLDRSEWMIVAILGVLKSGGAYVPVDPEYPKDRIEYILEDSACKVIIDEKELQKFNEYSANEKNAKTPLAAIAKPKDLAYVIYTSGSTGKPKGVIVEHTQVVNLILSQIRSFEITEEENILQFSNVFFDASVEQIFIALLSGARLSLIDKQTMIEPEKLEAFIESNKITHVHSVPSVLKNITAKKYPHLKRVIAGGDTCPIELAEKWSKHHKFYNEYGPTETTVTSIELLYKRRKENQTVLLIGRPLSNTQVYILDKEERLTPVGVIGEICIGGDGVARGYLNRPELTAEKFVQDPFKDGERMYKTGDLGRWLADGNIEFIGRKDDQVKVRGYRIELGEVESVLQSHENIEDGVVVIKDDSSGEKHLVAYVVSKQTLLSTDLRAFLGKSLPSYMVPSYFVQMDALPLNHNGKINKKLLPSPEGLGMSSGIEYVAPRNETEKKLAERWQVVLRTEKIGIDDDFFQLGGNSIKAVNASRMEGMSVPIKVIYQHKTIRECTKALEDLKKNELVNDDLLTKYPDTKQHEASIVLIPYAGAFDNVYMGLAKELSASLNVYIVTMPWSKLDENTELKDSKWIKDKLLQEIKDKVTGRFVILGNSAGSSLALDLSFEMEQHSDSFIGLIQSAAAYHAKQDINENITSMANYTDDEIWDYLVIKLDKPEVRNMESRDLLIRNLRHDVDVSLNTLAYIKSTYGDLQLNSPLHVLYGDNDLSIASTADNYKGWQKFSKNTSYDSVKNGGHYFVQQNVTETADKIKNTIKGWLAVN